MSSEPVVDSPSYYQAELAGPYLCDALLLNHYEQGWLAVLEGQCDTHSDTIVAALGDPMTGEFETLYLSDYTIYEDLIVEADVIDEIDLTLEERDAKLQSADDLVDSISSSN